MKKYEQLEQQIEDLKKEVERLKAEEETSKFPHIFNRNRAIKFLEGFKHEDISYAFSWGSTPQGSRYWSKLYYDLVNNVVQKAPDEASAQVATMGPSTGILARQHRGLSLGKG